MKTQSICRWGLCAILLVCTAATAFAEESPRGRLLFLGVAYDEAPPKTQTADHYNYAPDNFIKLFREQSKELFAEQQFDTLKGNAATRAAVSAKLKKLIQTARADDLVFLYWGTHGGTGKEGWGANLPAGGHVLGTEIKAELGKLPCPSVVAISTCGSGGFIPMRAGQVDLPRNMAALCACQRQQTTHNELDVSLLEAMAGFGDRNGDGQVTVRETLSYVPIRYRKLMRDTEAADLQPVIGHGPDAALDRPLAKVGENHVAVVYDNKWYGASILERASGQAKVRYLGWDPTNPRGTFHFADEMVPAERIDEAGDFPPAEVDWNGTWYAAKVLKKTDEGYKIHYVGYPATDDEVVPPKRLRFPFPDSSDRPPRGPKPKKK